MHNLNDDFHFPAFIFKMYEIMVLESQRMFEINCACTCVIFLSLEDFDVEEEDEEALIEQRRIQRQAIVQVADFSEMFVVLFK